MSFQCSPCAKGSNTMNGIWKKSNSQIYPEPGVVSYDPITTSGSSINHGTEENPDKKDFCVVDISGVKKEEWILQNFKKLECTRFVPVEASEVLSEKEDLECCCGRLKRSHLEEIFTPRLPSQPPEKWDQEHDVVECPTDAHGEVIFDDEGGQHKAPAKAAQSVGAWIITGGLDVGVNRIVGTAVRENQTLQLISREEVCKINCIGIAAWGYIQGHDHLVNRDPRVSKKVNYKVSKEVLRKHPVPLNPNHTHFLMVDNGTKNKYGAATVFRPLIESAINKPEADNGLGVPVVLLALEGGVDTIVAAKNAVQHRIPIVVCEGTGRAADIIAFAHKHAKLMGNKRQLHASRLAPLMQKIRHAFGSGYDNDSDKMKMVIENVYGCIQEESLVTVFDMIGNTNEDLDHAILLALLKAEATGPYEQLTLALSWHRADIAKNKILTDKVAWEWSSLHSCITTACVNNQVEFLSIFLEHGVIMKEYLTVSALRGLYNYAGKNSFLRNFVGTVSYRDPQQQMYLSDIGRVIRKLIGAHDMQLYRNDRKLDNKECSALIMMSSCLAGMSMLHSAQEEFLMSEEGQLGLLTTGPYALTMAELANPGMHFKQPFRELFLWAVLNEKRFEQLAINVLEECHDTNEDLAQMLVDRPYSCWGGKNSISMAAETGNQAFIAHACCQGLLLRIWNGALRGSSLRVLLGIICPLSILWMHYRQDYSYGMSSWKLKKKWWLKFYYFYTAPVTKFWLNVLTYLIFTLLFTYMLMFSLEDKPSVLEIVLFGWICTYAAQELQEAIFPGELETVRHKMQRWASSEWNLLDCLLIIVGMTAFILHWFDATKHFTLPLYAVNGFLVYTRILRMFAISPDLGPKMVMIKNMMKEMLLFVSVLLVVLLGHGVSSQALMNPNQELSLTALKNTFYMPYFQIYGELFLDAFVDGTTENCGLPDSEPCPTKHFLLPILLSFYLLFTNVLLLNLLIAIFSHVFDEVQENSLEVWRYELYWLVMEFHHRPSLPLPFMIIEHFFQLLKAIYQRGLRCCRRNKDGYEMRDLRVFEKECTAKYKMKKSREATEGTPERLERLESRLDLICTNLEQMKEGPTNPEPALQKHLSLSESWNLPMDLDKSEKINAPMLHQNSPQKITRQEAGPMNDAAQPRPSVSFKETRNIQEETEANSDTANRVLQHHISLQETEFNLESLDTTLLDRISNRSGLKKRKKHKRISKLAASSGREGGPQIVSVSQNQSNSVHNKDVKVQTQEGERANSSPFMKTSTSDQDVQEDMNNTAGNVANSETLPPINKGKDVIDSHIFVNHNLDSQGNRSVKNGCVDNLMESKPGPAECGLEAVGDDMASSLAGTADGLNSSEAKPRLVSSEADARDVSYHHLESLKLLNSRVSKMEDRMQSNQASLGKIQQLLQVLIEQQVKKDN
ncbi:Transient receptor potential cation channel subfamily M member 3 [Holothuria leucospilota]|uniref:Transient receptor potential cation channel subfamily M member 3 n=1 Tax=Holothuria leucospilota TaxID=206669 RepID=A0A9Q0YQA9_HOLLE|nr:Transient receptor potential cation channel subfamily M member 3 [Holothuria leucospilota]